MQISGISANDPIFGQTDQANDALGKDAFLTLLVNQLKNQDPLEPTQNEAFVAQLAQFSQLEGIEELNENIVGLAVLQQGNALLSQLTDSSALIGKSVRFVDPTSGAEREGIVESVKIEEGFAQLNIGGENIPLGNVLEVTLADESAPDAGAPSEDSDTAETTNDN